MGDGDSAIWTRFTLHNLPGAGVHQTVESQSDLNFHILLSMIMWKGEEWIADTETLYERCVYLIRSCVE